MQYDFEIQILLFDIFDKLIEFELLITLNFPRPRAGRELLVRLETSRSDRFLARIAWMALITS